MLTFSMKLNVYQDRLIGLKKEIGAMEQLFNGLANHKLDSKMPELQKYQFQVLANHTSKLVQAEMRQFWFEYYQVDDL